MAGRQQISHAGLTRALDAVAETFLANSADLATSTAPGITVHTELSDVDPRVTLVALSQAAHLVVLGSRGRGPAQDRAVGVGERVVARHAQCPVVVCRPSDPEPAATRVVVGADGGEASRPVLEYAFAQASLHRLSLTVMHCFWDVAAATAAKASSGRAGRISPTCGCSWPRPWPGCPRSTPTSRSPKSSRAGSSTSAWPTAVPPAQLLVVGRADSHGWTRFVHTSCALAVLERARTTVVVVPEHTSGRNQR